MGRLEKVNEQLKREIGRIIQSELNDPRLEFISITQAAVSADLRNAKVFFSVIGDSQKMLSAQQGLDAAKGIIRRMIGQRMKMRYTPELAFYYDESLEYSARIEETLQEIHNESIDNHSENQEE